MSKIKLLDESTVQKIAAGEIIERPVSVVKELVENSLDANSSSITVEISAGGKDYIRITDDGDGFLPEDLKIAFKRHSTSKISEAKDLYNITTFGFRGEALASISTVSKVEVLTKIADSLSGIQAFVEEREIIKQKLIGCPKGTTMIVRDLFYNIPVRQKFLKSDKVEASLIDDMLYKLALGNSNISFKYIKDNKIIFTTSKNNDLISNIYSLLGKDFYNNLVELSYDSKDFRIYGYISNNNFYRGNRKHQYLYVNNRYVRNKEISNLIEYQYRSLIPINKFPVFIIFIDINPSLIDVNIHPTKQEIKFMNQQYIYEALNKSISDLLSKHLYIQKITFNSPEKKEEVKEELPLLFEKNYITEKEKRNIYNNFDNDNYSTEKKNINSTDIPYNDILICEDRPIEDINVDLKNNELNDVDKENHIDNIKKLFEDIKVIGVIFSTYILLEDTKNDKLLIIDQHAAHERVMYEKYLEEYESESIAIQTLLTPELVELSNYEFELVMENIELLTSLGFIVEEFGQNSVLIRGVPILFGKPEVKNFFLELVDSLKSDIKSSYDIRLEKIMKIACTNAVKGGDKITDIEIQSLIKQLKKAKNPYTCPHGRPTIIEISKKDIEKEFKRIN